MGSACSAIKNQFEQLKRNAYYSDLPAQGLAFGYFYNFVKPAYRRLSTAENPLETDGPWTPDQGFRIHIVIPRQFLGREKVEQEFKKHQLVKLDLNLMDGRNISVYRARRAAPEARLDVFDIPTTLMTSLRVIERVNAFWGGGEAAFPAQLEKREIVNFRRAIADIIEDDRELAQECLPVVNMDDFEDLMKRD